MTLLAERADAEADSFVGSATTDGARCSPGTPADAAARAGFFAGRQAHAVREAAGQVVSVSDLCRRQPRSVERHGAAQPPGAWQYEFASQRYTQIAPVATPGVDLSALVRPELRKYKAQDGLELSGWLSAARASSNRVRSC